MTVRFNRSEIAVVNNLKKNNAVKNRGLQQRENVAVPSEESFAYVLEKARAGNEMAAVQIDEWYRFCRAGNSREKSVLDKVRIAADEIFE